MRRVELLVASLMAGAACSGCLFIDGLVGTEYVLVSNGQFIMGSPQDEVGRRQDEEQHEVTLTRDFYLKTTEVTQGEWRKLMGTNPSHNIQCGEDCPVEFLSWFQAVDYLNALSRSEGFDECYGGTGSERTFVGLSCSGYRLATEAEWEYAARAGTLGTRYGELDDIAWYDGNDGNNDSETRPVGEKSSNAWGLHDMLGNAWEWVHDWYGDYDLVALVDPVGPGTGSNRVIRGGCWSGGTGGNDGCRAADRSLIRILLPGERHHRVGFRPARSASP